MHIDTDSERPHEVSAISRLLGKRIVIDLCGAEFIDSSGLAALMNVKRRTVRVQGALAVACDVPSTLRLLETTRLDRALEVSTTVAEAIESLTPEEPRSPEAR